MPKVPNNTVVVQPCDERQKHDGSASRGPVLSGDDGESTTEDEMESSPDILNPNPRAFSKTTRNDDSKRDDYCRYAQNHGQARIRETAVDLLTPAVLLQSTHKPSSGETFSVAFATQQLGLTLAASKVEDRKPNKNDGPCKDEGTAVFVVVCQVDLAVIAKSRGASSLRDHDIDRPGGLSSPDRIRVGDLVVAVGGISMAGVPLEEVERRVVRGARPLEVRFERPPRDCRNGAGSAGCRSNSGRGSAGPTNSPMEADTAPAVPTWSRPLGGLEQPSCDSLLDIISDIATLEGSLPESQLLPAPNAARNLNEDDVGRKAGVGEFTSSTSLAIAQTTTAVLARAEMSSADLGGGLTPAVDKAFRCLPGGSHTAQEEDRSVLKTILPSASLDSGRVPGLPAASVETIVSTAAATYHSARLPSGEGVSESKGQVADRYVSSATGRSRLDDQNANPRSACESPIERGNGLRTGPDPRGSLGIFDGHAQMKTFQTALMQETFEESTRRAQPPPRSRTPAEALETNRDALSQSTAVTGSGEKVIAPPPGYGLVSPTERTADRPGNRDNSRGDDGGSKPNTKRQKMTNKTKVVGGYSGPSFRTTSSSRQGRDVSIVVPTATEVTCILTKLGTEAISELTLYKDLSFDDLVKLCRYTGVDVSKRLRKATMAERLNIHCKETGALAGERQMRSTATVAGDGGDKGRTSPSDICQGDVISTPSGNIGLRIKHPSSIARSPAIAAPRCHTSDGASKHKNSSARQSSPIPSPVRPPLLSTLSTLQGNLPSSPPSSFAIAPSAFHRTPFGTIYLPPTPRQTPNLPVAASIPCPSPFLAREDILSTRGNRSPTATITQESTSKGRREAHYRRGADRRNTEEEWTDWNYQENALPALRAKGKGRGTGIEFGKDVSDDDDDDEESWWQQRRDSDGDWSACSSPPSTPASPMPAGVTPEVEAAEVTSRDRCKSQSRRNPLLPGARAGYVAAADGATSGGFLAVGTGFAALPRFALRSVRRIGIQVSACLSACSLVSRGRSRGFLMG